jgi:hypothetical protein
MACSIAKDTLSLDALTGNPPLPFLCWGPLQTPDLQDRLLQLRAPPIAPVPMGSVCLKSLTHSRSHRLNRLAEVDWATRGGEGV